MLPPRHLAHVAAQPSRKGHAALQYELNTRHREHVDAAIGPRVHAARDAAVDADLARAVALARALALLPAEPPRRPLLGGGGGAGGGSSRGLQGSASKSGWFDRSRIKFAGISDAFWSTTRRRHSKPTNCDAKSRTSGAGSSSPNEISSRAMRTSGTMAVPSTLILRGAQPRTSHTT